MIVAVLILGDNLIVGMVIVVGHWKIKWLTVVVVGEIHEKEMTEKRLLLLEEKLFSRALDSSMLLIPKMNPGS